MLHTPHLWARSGGASAGKEKFDCAAHYIGLTQFSRSTNVSERPSFKFTVQFRGRIATLGASGVWRNSAIGGVIEANVIGWRVAGAAAHRQTEMAR